MKAKNPKTAKSPLKKSKKSSKKPVENSNKKSTQMLLAFGILGMVGGGVAMAAGFLTPGFSSFNAVFPGIPSKQADNNIYSNLTGLPLASAADVTAPAFCVQTPNGVDGARPQAGLNEAGVIFEAIAETGITRFAVVYQNPTSSIIGPIRSLRTYYLEWDTPFDCTIVHAGGSGDALAAVARGYKDLTESYTYMYRGTYGARRWNNLFTTSFSLLQMNEDRGYGGSEIKGFTRMTPAESLAARVNSTVEEKLVIYEASGGGTSTFKPSVAEIAVNFGSMPNFNVRYDYDASSNTYLRSYASGASHDIYDCPAADFWGKNPEDNCALKQLAPAVVAVIEVSEKRASDGYHEDITTTDSGEAHIFQNGMVIEGTWKKPSVSEQIRFYDAAGTEIALAPGQTFVEAIPKYGSVEY